MSEQRIKVIGMEYMCKEGVWFYWSTESENWESVAILTADFLNYISKVAGALEVEWYLNHDEHCTNMQNCGSFEGGGGGCFYGRPEILKQTMGTLAKPTDD